jgi:hypothetical protein
MHGLQPAYAAIRLDLDQPIKSIYLQAASCKLQVAGRRLQATSHFLNEEAEHDNELGHFPDTDDKPAKSISGHLE